MRISPTTSTSRKRKDGLAAIIMLILLTIVLGLILANMNTLSALHNDVKRIEQRQIRRINPATPQATTNAPTSQSMK